MPTPARILIIDDDPHVLDAHARYLRALGHEVETASDGIEGLALLELGADLVMVDAEMPNMDGFSVAMEIRKNPEHETLPIVMVAGLVRQGYRLRAYEVGINDFINKPVDPDELKLKLRLRWLLELKSTRDQLSEANAELEGAVERRTQSLKKALAEAAEAKRLTYQINIEMLRRLTVTAEYKDPGAVGHVSRVGRYCEVLAGAMGFSPQEAEVMRHAAPLHDIGKTAISDSILFKPGPLDENEWVTMRSHTTIGGEILAGSQSQVLQVGSIIARSHHELWEGAVIRTD